jgi:hypothetical protein
MKRKRNSFLSNAVKAAFIVPDMVCLAAVIACAVQCLRTADNTVLFGVNAALFLGAVIFRFALGMFLAKTLPRRFLRFEDKNITAFLGGADTPAVVITLTAKPFLPGKSVTEKIMYGNFQATAEELRKAADSALLPHGIDEAAYLSPADKQKIAFARALLYHPEKIVIAEGLSACDGVTIRRIKAYTVRYYPDIDIT